MQKNISQKERVSQELMKLNQDITEQDRTDYMQEKKASRATLSNYMNGKVFSVDRALEMLMYFRNKVSQREKLINQE